MGPPRFEGGGVDDKHEGAVLLVEEIDTPFLDSEELRALVVEGRERGYLTFEEIAACLEEVEVTKEQVRDLHLHLLDAGIEIVSEEARADGAENPPPRRRTFPRSPRST